MSEALMSPDHHMTCGQLTAPVPGLNRYSTCVQKYDEVLTPERQQFFHRLALFLQEQQDFPFPVSGPVSSDPLHSRSTESESGPGSAACNLVFSLSLFCCYCYSHPL